MSAPFLVAVDPGLDAAGVATFDLGIRAPRFGPGVIAPWHPRETFQDVMSRLSRYEVLRTSPAWVLPRRLGYLARGLQEIVPNGATHVIIEQSRIPGVYARARARQQSKNAINAAALEKLFFAVGALTAGAELAMGPVEMVYASPLSKPIRHRLVLTALKQLDHPLAKRARPSPDLLDAIWLGAAWLTHPSRKEWAA